MLRKFFYVLFFGLVAAFVFKVYFSESPLVWGDAPHFFASEFDDLIVEPSVWTNRGYSLGGVNRLIFMSPIMLIYGLLGKYLNLGNGAILRILFYFPSLLLSFLGPFFLARHFKLSFKSGVFVSFLYTFNTYYLLLVDGGVVGISLAYGLFPLCFLVINKYLDRGVYSVFWISLLSLFLLTVIDPRLSLILDISLFIFLVANKVIYKDKDFFIRMLKLVSLNALNICLSAYWIIPLFKLGERIETNGVSGLKVVSWLNALTLFQPHWPENIFGVTSQIPIYFFALTLLAILSLLSKDKIHSLTFFICFVVLSLLAKGESSPFGFVYQTLVEKVPFAYALRDSSKFFAPLILFAGLSIGVFLDSLRKEFFRLATFFLVLVTVLPAVRGELSFVLSGKKMDPDFLIVEHKLTDGHEFFRTAWFPERHPYTFETETNPALDARDLADFRPFSVLNVGSDRFNFLNNGSWVNWLRLLGVRFLIFSGDFRNPTSDSDLLVSWNRNLGLISATKGINKLDWGTKFPVYEIENTLPRVFAIDKLYGVVGPELPILGDIPTPAIYFEDGKLDPKNLQDLQSPALEIIFNGKSEIDLTMSFLKANFVPPSSAKSSDWMIYDASEYLNWKYQLLIRGIDTKEFDYSKGVALSTIENEKIDFSFKTRQSTDYVLCFRFLLGEQEGSVDFSIDNEVVSVSVGKQKEFEWFCKDKNLKKGKVEVALTSKTGLVVLNTIALVTKKDWQEAATLSNNFIKNFGVAASESIKENKLYEVSYDKSTSFSYDLGFPVDGNWIIFTDQFSPKWAISRDQIRYGSVPVYSLVNGFYRHPGWDKAGLVFEGQKEFRWGIYWSGVSVLILTITFIWFYPKRNER